MRLNRKSPWTDVGVIRDLRTQNIVRLKRDSISHNNFVLLTFYVWVLPWEVRPVIFGRRVTVIREKSVICSIYSSTQNLIQIIQVTPRILSLTHSLSYQFRQTLLLGKTVGVCVNHACFDRKQSRSNRWDECLPSFIDGISANYASVTSSVGSLFIATVPVQPTLSSVIPFFGRIDLNSD